MPLGLFLSQYQLVSFRKGFTMMCLSTSSRFVFAVGDTAAYSQVQARPPLTYILSYFIKRPDLLGCRVVFKARPNQHHLHDPNNQHPLTYLAHLSPTSSYPPLHNAICQDPATTSVPFRATLNTPCLQTPAGRDAIHLPIKRHILPQATHAHPTRWTDSGSQASRRPGPIV